MSTLSGKIHAFSVICVLNDSLIQTAVFICNITFCIFLQLSYMNRTGTCKHINVGTVILIIKKKGQVMVVTVQYGFLPHTIFDICG